MCLNRMYLLAFFEDRKFMLDHRGAVVQGQCLDERDARCLLCWSLMPWNSRQGKEELSNITMRLQCTEMLTSVKSNKLTSRFTFYLSVLVLGFPRTDSGPQSYPWICEDEGKMYFGKDVSLPSGVFALFFLLALRVGIRELIWVQCGLAHSEDQYWVLVAKNGQSWPVFGL